MRYKYTYKEGIGFDINDPIPIVKEWESDSLADFRAIEDKWIEISLTDEIAYTINCGSGDLGRFALLALRRGDVTFWREVEVDFLED